MSFRWWSSLHRLMNSTIKIFRSHNSIYRIIHCRIILSIKIINST
ncbi:hypothetical protein Smp_133760 [Schistosoma mansoni]|nr:hypothetical protein Smp_133760 [Schistosoma mansoni]|eukprot:XP_018654551.1 hypothetical protein Smp_133760 [Schistosoma mansoni]